MVGLAIFVRLQYFYLLDYGIPVRSNREYVLGIILILPSSTDGALGRRVEILMLMSFYLGHNLVIFSTVVCREAQIVGLF